MVHSKHVLLGRFDDPGELHTDCATQTRCGGGEAVALPRMGQLVRRPTNALLRRQFSDSDCPIPAKRQLPQVDVIAARSLGKEEEM